MRELLLAFLFIITVSSGMKERLQTQFCGSWIVAENKYQNALYIFDAITRYHQINSTLDDAVDGLLVSEVDVVSGELKKALYTVVIREETNNKTMMQVDSLFDTSSYSFIVHEFENELIVGALTLIHDY